MEKFEIFQELPKCDTEMNALEKLVPIDSLNVELPQTFNL